VVYSILYLIRYIYVTYIEKQDFLSLGLNIPLTLQLSNKRRSIYKLYVPFLVYLFHRGLY